MLVHVIGQAVLAVVTGGASFLIAGISQLTYFVPWGIWAIGARRSAFVYVMSIVAGVTFLGTQACWTLALTLASF